MKSVEKKTQKEIHPLFPSGEWEGFYTYYFGPDAERHRMAFYLDFHNNMIKGTGSDDIGGFFWEGIYETEAFTCAIVKSYRSHQVHYCGHADENGIWGSWTLNFLKGGFHIWPKATEEEARHHMEKERAKVKTLGDDNLIHWKLPRRIKLFN